MIQSEKMNEPYNLSLCIYRCHFDAFDAIVLLYIYICVCPRSSRMMNICLMSSIIFLKGTSQSMPWLAELVEASEGSLDMLPVQCLCEFLLHDPHQVSTPETSDDDGCKAERQRRKQVA